MAEKSFPELELRKFLVQAKRNTYASSGEGGEKVLADGSKEFEFRSGDFRYRDRYFGYNPFIGEEVVFYKGKAVWAMNYSGKVVSDEMPASEIYQFLQNALLRVQQDKPFRGPAQFQEGAFRYTNEVRGNIKDFFGTERIYIKDIEIYRLDFNGGQYTNILIS